MDETPYPCTKLNNLARGFVFQDLTVRVQTETVLQDDGTPGAAGPRIRLSEDGGGRQAHLASAQGTGKEHLCILFCRRNLTYSPELSST